MCYVILKKFFQGALDILYISLYLDDTMKTSNSLEIRDSTALVKSKSNSISALVACLKMQIYVLCICLA